MATPSSGLSNLSRLCQQEAPLPPAPPVAAPPAVSLRDLKRERQEEEEKEDFFDQKIHALFAKSHPKKTKIEEEIFKNNFKSRLSDSRDLGTAALFLRFSNKSPEKILREAVSEGLKPLVEKLISTGMDLDSQKERGETLVKLALKNGHLDIATLLIKAGAKDEKGQSLLIRSVLKNELSILPALVLKEEMLNDCDSLGLTPIMHAVQSDHMEAFDIVLKAKPNLNVLSEESFTALHYAVGMGRIKMALKLIESHADLNVGTRSGMTPLMLALSGDHKELVEALLMANAQIGLMDSKERSVLSQVVQTDQMDYFLLFLEAHSKTSQSLSLSSSRNRFSSRSCEDLSRDFSLLYALREGKKEMALELAKRGIGVHFSNFDRSESPLIWAVKQNFYLVVKALIDVGVDLDSCDREEKSAIDYVVLLKNKEMEELLMAAGALNTAGETLLTHAIKKNDRGAFESALKFFSEKREIPLGEDQEKLIDKTNKDCFSPLRLALQKKREEMVKLLVDAGADVSNIDQDGYSIIQNAFRDKVSNSMMRLLIEGGANVNAHFRPDSSPIANERYLNRPLRVATFGGNLELMKLLVLKGANLGKYQDDPEQDEETILTILARVFDKNLEVDFELQEKIFQFLLDKGADINAQNSLGHSVLMFAVENENEFLVDFLIKKGADLNLRAKNRCSALLVAKSFGFGDIEALLWQGGAIDHSTGNSCLISATLGNNIPLIQQQIARGVDLNVQNLKGESALSIAVVKNDGAMLNLLLDAGAKLNLQGKNGYTPLLQTAFDGNDRLAGLLIAKGANLKMRAYDGSTALHLAVKERNTQTLKLLIASGIDLEAKNNQRLTALCMAVEAGPGHQGIVKLLMEAGARDEHGFTPLMRALRTGKMPDLLKLLKDKANGNHKIDLNAEVERRPATNALFFSCSTRNVDAFIELVKAGVNLSFYSSTRGSGFMMMLRLFSKEEISKYSTLMEFLFPLSAPIFIEQAKTSGKFSLENWSFLKSVYEKTRNGYEILKYLFLCNQSTISDDLFKVVKNELESLQKEFPESRVYCNRLLTRHLRMLPHVIAKSEKDIPAAPSVELNVFLSLFNEINFSDPKNRGYAHPHLLKDDGGNPLAVESLKKELALYVKRIKNQEPFLGTPAPQTPELKDYYTRLTNIAGHLALKIQDPTIDADNKTSLLIDLAKASSHCGARYMMDSYFWYQRIVKPQVQPITVPEKIFRALTEFRQSILEQLVLTQTLESNALVPEGNLPHVRNQYLKLIGEEFGLPETASTHDDHAFNLKHLTRELARQGFVGIYNPASIIAHLEAVLLDPAPSALKYQEVIAWFEDNIPDDWKSEFYVKLTEGIAYKIENEKKEFTEFSSEKRERLINEYMEKVIFANYQFKWQDKHLETPYTLENIEKAIDASEGLTAQKRKNMKEGIGRALLAFKDPDHLAKLRLKKLLNEEGLDPDNLEKWRDSIPQLRSQAYLQEEVCLDDGTQGFKFSALVYMLAVLKVLG